MATVVDRPLALDEDLAFALQMQEVLEDDARGNSHDVMTSLLDDIGTSHGASDAFVLSSSEEGDDVMSLYDDVGLLCEICQETEPLGSMVFLSCMHAFCISCLAQHGKVSLEAKKLPIPCPAPGCKCAISVEASCVFLEGEDYLKALHDVAELSIGEEERFYCPYKDCSVLMVKDAQDPGEDARATCQECNRDVCMGCGVPWHEGATCAEYRAAPEGERDPDDFKLKQLASNSDWKRCHSCRAIVERSSGCPHMTCRCGAQFCYTCSRPYISNQKSCNC